MKVDTRGDGRAPWRARSGAPAPSIASARPATDRAALAAARAALPDMATQRVPHRKSAWRCIDRGRLAGVARAATAAIRCRNTPGTLRVVSPRFIRHAHRGGPRGAGLDGGRRGRHAAAARLGRRRLDQQSARPRGARARRIRVRRTITRCTAAIIAAWNPRPSQDILAAQARVSTRTCGRRRCCGIRCSTSGSAADAGSSTRTTTRPARSRFAAA